MSGRRPWALPLVPLYAAGLRLSDAMRGAGWLRTQRLGWPVVSVGSLSAGGAGKTPVVITLAELLSERGWSVDVLSRGYRREGTGVERVDTALRDAARRFGDEPALIAQRTGAPVWVGASRYAAGMAAEDAAGRVAGSRAVHLLDDGFQHRALARAFDVALLTAEDVEDRLLPAGNLRESLRALQRADAVVVREDELPSMQGEMRRWMREETPIWTIRRGLSISSRSGITEVETGLPWVAFCGIARPEGFFGMLRAAGLELAAAIPYPDHYKYTREDVRRVVHSCHLGACRFITTEKDAVKLGPEVSEELERAGGLWIGRLDAEFLEPARVVEALEERLR